MTDMTSPTSITNADEAKLIEYIAEARQRLVYLAPGVSEPLARALADRWRHLGCEAVTVILDVDPEVCRLGYGTIEGLKLIRDEASRLGALVSHQPGVRIGVLIADDRTLIFSPTPLLIEAGSDAPERPNAIELSTSPPALLQDVGLGPRGPSDQAVGLDPVEPERLAELEQDLESAPPVKFDLARRVRVFTSRFQFVELEMAGCFISRRKVRIPSSLVGLARQDIERQFHAHFDLIQRGGLAVESHDGKVITERSLDEKRRDLVRRFLVLLAGYGSVILRAKKKEFNEAVEELRRDVEAFSKGVKDQLQKQIERSRDAVVEALLPAVERNPPDEYTKAHGPRPPRDFLRRRLIEDIGRAFGTADRLVNDMRVNLVFKDVAYESLVDEKFLEIARSALPDVKFLHDEYDAVAAQGAQR